MDHGGRLSQRFLICPTLSEANPVTSMLVPMESYTVSQ